MNVDAIGKLSSLFGSNALATMLAVSLLAVAFLFVQLIRAKDRHLAREAQLSESHARALSELQGRHAIELSEVRDRELENAIRIVSVSEALAGFASDIQQLAKESREKRQRRQQGPT